MSLESFYGGRPGISPVIRKSFKYVTSKIDDNGKYIDPAYGTAIAAGKSTAEINAINAETMDECFNSESYTDVWYNELCIIDATNKNNPFNGALYRRTLKGAGDENLKNLTAEYIGHIAGPAGGTPFMDFGPISSVQSKFSNIKENILSFDGEVYYLSEDDLGNIGASTAISSTSKLGIKSNGINENMLVPGKTTEIINNESYITYNDDIKYTWFNIVNNVDDETGDNPTLSTVYLGYQIPYSVFNFTGSMVNWTDEVDISGGQEITPEDGKVHPFSYKYNIQIPRGIRGNAASNIRLVQYKNFNDNNVLYSWDDIINNDGVFSIRTLSGTDSDHYGPSGLTGDNWIWVYDYTFYGKTADGGINAESEVKTYTFFLGKYKEIENIILNEDGTIDIKYLGIETKETLDNKLQWIKNITCDTDGLLTITYNTKNSEDKNKTENFQLPFPQSASINNTGEINFNFKNPSSSEFPITITLKEENSTQDKNFILNYVDNISMDDTTKILSKHFKNGSSEVLNNGKPINYIDGTTVDRFNHLLVHYASNEYRPTKNSQGVEDISSTVPGATNTNITFLKWNNKIYRDGVGISDNYNIGTNNNDTENISGTSFWHDLGLVKNVMQGVRIYSELNFIAQKDTTEYDFFEDYERRHGNEIDINGIIDLLNSEWKWPSSDSNNSNWEFEAGTQIVSETLGSGNYKITFENDDSDNLTVVTAVFSNDLEADEIELSNEEMIIIEDYCRISSNVPFTLSDFDPENDVNKNWNPYYPDTMREAYQSADQPPNWGYFYFTNRINDTGTAYYFDYEAETWRYAGAWGESSTTAVNIQKNNSSLIYDATLSDFGLLFVQVSNFEPVSLKESLIDVWETG